MAAQHRAETNGHRLILTHLPAHAEGLLELTGVRALLTIEQPGHPRQPGATSRWGTPSLPTSGMNGRGAAAAGVTARADAFF